MKYKENEEFFEVTFDVPKKLSLIQIKDLIFSMKIDVCNLKIIPCKMVVEPKRLSVSKDDYSFDIWKNKQKSQIVK